MFKKSLSQLRQALTIYYFLSELLNAHGNITITVNIEDEKYEVNFTVIDQK
jgi:hypothetical protein